MITSGGTTTNSSNPRAETSVLLFHCGYVKTYLLRFSKEVLYPDIENHITLQLTPRIKVFVQRKLKWVHRYRFGLHCAWAEAHGQGLFSLKVEGYLISGKKGLKASETGNLLPSDNVSARVLNDTSHINKGLRESRQSLILRNTISTWSRTVPI
jgi:hypothetical protein